MLVTLDEAKDMKCPISFAHTDKGFNCIGDRCMAWRRLVEVDEASRAEYIAGKIQRIDIKTTKLRGYCGLSGE